MKKEDLENLFLHQKPAKLLVKIKEGQGTKYASVLSKEVDCTYSHCVRLLQIMKNFKLIEFEKKGRINIIKLTKLGEDVAFAIENLVRVLERVNL